MAIISSVVAQISSEPGEWERVREEHTDHTGTTYPFRYKSAKGSDPNVVLAEHAEKLLKRLERGEAEFVQTSVMDGDDPSVINLDFITPQQALKAILKGYMETPPDQAVLASQWLNSSVTDGQIETVTNVIVRQKIRARSANILSMAAALADDANHVIEVE